MNAIGKKWMSRELYETCLICDGQGEIPAGGFRGRYERIATAPGQVECPGCGGDRFVSIGLTVGQLEELKAENDGFKALLGAAQ